MAGPQEPILHPLQSLAAFSRPAPSLFPAVPPRRGGPPLPFSLLVPPSLIPTVTGPNPALLLAGTPSSGLCCGCTSACSLSLALPAPPVLRLIISTSILPSQICRYRSSVEDVPVGEFTLPLGQARVVREGSDVTLVGWGQQVSWSKQGGFRRYARWLGAAGDERPRSYACGSGGHRGVGCVRAAGTHAMLLQSASVHHCCMVQHCCDASVHKPEP